MNPLRLYLPHELGPDGYPPEWHKLECTLCQGLGKVDAYKRADGKQPVRRIGEIDCLACLGSGNLPIKSIIRAQADHRCVRCKHPYRAGDERISAKGEWSPCDEQCTHATPVRYFNRADPERYYIPGQTQDFVAWEVREAQWRILTVHHLDGNKANCRWWNLAALCQRDHLYVQGRVQMARVWPWEHSPWMKPYVAGYYAHVYLGEDLDRPEVVARLDELLALELAS